MWTKFMVLLAGILAVGSVQAAQPSIHAMLVGQETLQLDSSWQVSFNNDGDVAAAQISPDGKWVAYLSGIEASESSPAQLQLKTVDLSEGRSKVLLSGPITLDEADKNAGAQEVWRPGVGIMSWSPGGKMLACIATHITVDEGRKTEENWLLVFSPTGMRKAAFQLPKDCDVRGGIYWSPDSRKLAAMTLCFAQSRHERGFYVFNLAKGTMDDLSLDKSFFNLKGWSADGESLQFVRLQQGGPSQLWQTDATGKSEKLILANYTDDEVSPDGVFALDKNKYPNLTVRSVTTGTTAKVLDYPSDSFIDWLPNSRMFTFRREDTVTDVYKNRPRIFNSIWLGSVETHKLNHMCVTLDSDKEVKPSWSANCTRMAYVCDKRAFVAELSWRAPTLQEKIAVQMPLTAEEQKVLQDEVVNQAKEIAEGMKNFSLDYNGNLPSADDLYDRLRPYVRDGDVFYLPGTAVDIFTFNSPGNLNKLSNPEQVAMGEMDAGYGWKVVIYADGHYEIKNK